MKPKRHLLIINDRRKRRPWWNPRFLHMPVGTIGARLVERLGTLL